MNTGNIKSGSYDRSAQLQSIAASNLELNGNQYKPGCLGSNWYNDNTSHVSSTNSWTTVYGNSYRLYGNTASKQEKILDRRRMKFHDNFLTASFGGEGVINSNDLSYREHLPIQGIANSDLNLTGYTSTTDAKWFAQARNNESWQTTYQLQFTKPTNGTMNKVTTIKPMARYQLEHVLRHVENRCKCPESKGSTHVLSDQAEALKLMAS